jgi:tRNA(Ile)-lysidine synthase
MAAVPTSALRYHVLVHSLAERVLSDIRRHQLLKAGDRVGVAVSGGIDSVALLRLLLELRGELGIVLSVVHFNHKLRGKESDNDEQFVSELSRAHGLEFLSENEDVAEHAAQENISVEAAARELRYGFFRHLLGSEITTGSEAHDQDPTLNRSVGSIAPPKDKSHGLEPHLENGHLSDPPESLFRGAVRLGAVTRRPSPEIYAPRQSDQPRKSEASLAKLDKIVTGHTLDDQAETVLMRLIRGTGLSGLSAIHPRIALDNDNGELSGEVMRPMLNNRRRELEQYLKDLAQPWREDSTNSDHAFTRNRVRRLLVPLLEKEFNPAVAENLAELAEIARGEEEYWDNEVAGWMGTAVHWVEPDWAQLASQKTLVQISLSGSQLFPSGDPDLQSRIDGAPWLVANASVSRPWFLSEPIAVQRRVVKAVGEHAGIPLEFKHVEEIVRFAAEEPSAGRELTLPLGWKLERHPEELLFVTPDLREAKPPQDYEYELVIPGRIILPEAGITLEVHRIPANSAAEYNPDQLLDADSLPGPLRVRNWRAGDRFWPAHTKSPKKIKELLQDRHLAQPQRALWPLVVSGDQVVWLRGFAAHAKYGARPGRAALWIREQLHPVRAET